MNTFKILKTRNRYFKYIYIFISYFDLIQRGTKNVELFFISKNLENKITTINKVVEINPRLLNLLSEYKNDLDIFVIEYIKEILIWDIVHKESTGGDSITNFLQNEIRFQEIKIEFIIDLWMTKENAREELIYIRSHTENTELRDFIDSIFNLPNHF